MSRDWVIDKFQIGGTYDTNLEKARKLIKKIGQDLAEDPAFARHIIEPLKMQGEGQFGDFAIQIRCKMTPAGRAVRDRRKAFDESGIQFSTPMVQVSGSDETATAAARHVVEQIGAEKPAAA